ncbi:NUDIX domain-containing protein [Candidatus Dojkabacteria bacterium]|nr:NUDIX domain-containing protein [Candidatus Dojkabacteria bacterium]
MDRNKIIPAVYIFLIRNNQILLLKRKNSGYMDGYYSLVAGHVEKSEFPIDTCVREAFEEIGVNIKKQDLKFKVVGHQSGVVDRVDYFFECINWEGEIKIQELDKCDDLSWFDIDKLPANTTPYVLLALKCYQDNQSYFEFNG